ncbi:MAG TPA: hypothetical protein VMF64_11210 [Steroidobacteraceae bacterium]|nr:hypothetical protein [Steroidobacteraceae bacterium]
MNHRYFLPPQRDAGAAATLRYPPYVPTLKINDPAARAMTDFHHAAAPMVHEDLDLQHALDEMFRLGTRAFLVLREGVVTGLMSVEQAQPAAGARRVADVMTPAAQVPAVDWQIIEESRVGDLVDIFQGSGALHLLVLENENSQLAAVRGLIHRERLERQLGTRWAQTELASTRRPALR